MLPLILLMFHPMIEAFATTCEGLSMSSNASLLWDPYRPNLYLGLRPRTPNSLLMGLMWFNADDPSEISKSTHQKDFNCTVPSTDLGQILKIFDTHASKMRAWQAMGGRPTMSGKVACKLLMTPEINSN